VVRVLVQAAVVQALEQVVAAGPVARELVVGGLVEAVAEQENRKR